MTLRELSTHYKLYNQLERDREMLLSLRETAGLGAQKMTGMPHVTGVSDRVCNLVIEIEELEEQISHLEAECKREEEKIQAYINGIHDDQTRLIFRLRFLHCMTWWQVAEVIGGRNTASSVRAICYRHLKSCSVANTRER